MLVTIRRMEFVVVIVGVLVLAAIAAVVTVINDRSKERRELLRQIAENTGRTEPPAPD